MCIKTHGHVSAAKKGVQHTSVLFTGITKLPFLTPCISTTAGPICYIFCALYYTQLHMLNLKKFHSVVREIFVLKNTRFSSHFSSQHFRRLVSMTRLQLLTH